MDSATNKDSAIAPTVTVVSRVPVDSTSHITLSDGSKVTSRRFAAIGKGDVVRYVNGQLSVCAKKDNQWIDITTTWASTETVNIFGAETQIHFKEIESAEEHRLFEELRQFHYRGGGGAGRTVPIIATSELWDLPKILGFIEISSSMIANTARKRFLNYPYREATGLGWNSWDRSASLEYSNIICRISRFVIHPEIRGLGLAKYFTKAARQFAAEKWHYGGFRPRFLEITADMLRYYRFTDQEFAYMGETEGNEHRLGKDMTYLVKRALSPEGVKAMPQGGGGIMTLQRSYATRLIKYMKESNKGLAEAIASLRYEPGALDQDTWEALHRLNRRPKPCYAAGLTVEAKKYVSARNEMLRPRVTKRRKIEMSPTVSWRFSELCVQANSKMSQNSEARQLQDIFGFVGSDLSTTIVDGFNLTLFAGEICLICGASGSGKSLLLEAIQEISMADLNSNPVEATGQSGSLIFSGEVEGRPKTMSLRALPQNVTPLSLRGNSSLEDFLEVAASCGLAEPQLFVRPVSSLSSGQQYRLQIALLFLKKPEVMLIDNFCESLDRFTTLAICNGIQRLAKKTGISVVVATAAYDRLAGIFEADQTVLLRRGDGPVILRKHEI